MTGRHVRVQCPLLAQIELPVAGDRGKEGIEQVVAFFVEQAVVLGEEFLELGDRVLHLGAVFVVDHNRQRELAEVLALHAECGQRLAEFGDGGLFGVVHQFVARPAVLPVLKIRDKTGLGVMVMPAARSDLFSRLRVIDRMPLGDDMEVGRNVE